MKRVFTTVLATVIALSTAVSAMAESTTVKTEYGELILAPYKGLEATQYIYEVNDEDVDFTIESMLTEYADYNEVSSGAEIGNIIYANMTAEIDGEVVVDFSEEETELYLGYETYGTEFDEKITGAKAGDELKFSISYDEDDENAEYPGETVDYTINVKRVMEEIIPELSEDFIKNTLGYESEEDMRVSLRAEAEEANAEGSINNAKASLLDSVVQKSEFISYDEDKLAEMVENIKSSYENYMALFDVETLNELMDYLRITEEQLTEEAKETLKQQMVISAIAGAEGISVSDEEFIEGAANYALLYEFEDVDEFIELAGEDAIRTELLSEKVLDILYNEATITETPATDVYEYSEEDFEELDDEEISDEGLVWDEDIEDLEPDVEAE